MFPFPTLPFWVFALSLPLWGEEARKGEENNFIFRRHFSAMEVIFRPFFCRRERIEKKVYSTLRKIPTEDRSNNRLVGSFNPFPPLLFFSAHPPSMTNKRANGRACIICSTDFLTVYIENGEQHSTAQKMILIQKTFVAVAFFNSFFE